MRHDDDEPMHPWTVESIAHECLQSSFQRFIRDNYGLWHPPADYAALRRENLKRTAAANRRSLCLA
jgi:hypothetical protein